MTVQETPEVRIPLAREAVYVEHRGRWWKAISAYLAVVSLAMLAIRFIFLAVRYAEGTRGSYVSRSSVVETYDWCPGYDPKTAPLSQYLLCESQYLLDDAYATVFISGIKSGELDPRGYAKYDIQELAYLKAVSDLYVSLCDQTDNDCDATLKHFFENRSERFGEVADRSLSSNIVQSDLSGVMPVDRVTQVSHRGFPSVVFDVWTQAYIDFEKDTAARHPVQYSAVSMAPCMIWGPLADRLAKEGARREGNVYNFWIDENRGYVPGRLNAIVDDPAYEYVRQVALPLFREGVQHEIDLFNLATPPRAA